MKDTINGLNAADNNSHSKTPQHVSYLCSFYTVFYLVILQSTFVQLEGKRGYKITVF